MGSWSGAPPTALASAGPSSLELSRLGNNFVAGHKLVCKRRSKWGRCRRHDRLSVQAPRAALLDPPPFDASKLRIEYLPGGREATLTAGRRYTLTHNDVTGSLQLSIGRDYNRSQLDGWYTRILRDEILAEWQDLTTPAPRSSSSSSSIASSSTLDPAAKPSLHIYCHVSGEELWPAPPQLRSFIFQREMSLVLDTISHAESALLAASPALAAAPVFVHLRSDVPALDRVVEWGVLGDRATWRTARSSVMRSLLSSVMGTLDEEGDDSLDGSAGLWSRAAFYAASSGEWAGNGSATTSADGEGALPVLGLQATDISSQAPEQQRQREQQQDEVHRGRVDMQAAGDLLALPACSGSAAAVVVQPVAVSSRAVNNGTEARKVAVSTTAANAAVGLATEHRRWATPSGASISGRAGALSAAEAATVVTGCRRQ